MRNWINLAERYSKVCRECGCVPSEISDKTINVIFSAKEKKKRFELTGNKYGYICSICCQAITKPPVEEKDSISSDRPKGWAFMKIFVDKNGNVFEKGVENKKLKGTLPPTEPKEKIVKEVKQKEIKLTKGQRTDRYHEAAAKLHILKKELAALLLTKYTKPALRDLEKKIKLQQKEIKKWS